MFLVPIPSETMHVIQIVNPCDAIHPKNIPLKINGVTSYFNVRKPTQAKYEDQNILVLNSQEKLQFWIHWAVSLVDKSRICLTSGDSLSALTLSKESIFINSVTLYAYDAADVMGNDNNANMVKSFVITSSLQVEQMNTKMVSGLNHLVFLRSEYFTWESI